MNNGIKVSIIGAGFVGATTAYSLINSGLVTEICINDINSEKAMGEAMDLAHGISFAKPVNIYAIIRDENSILTVSSYLQGEYGINDVFISVPTIVNRKGVEKILDIDLSTDERGQLKNSAHILKENCKKIN